MLKRLLAISMVLVFAFSFTACGENEAARADDNGTAAASDDVAPVPGALGGAGYSRHPAGHINAFGWEIPEETIYLTILFGAGNHSVWASEEVGLQNHLRHYREEFNVYITPVFIMGDGAEYVNLALASGNYPYDIIADIDRTLTQLFVDQGRAVELTPFLDNIGSDLYDRIQHFMPMLTDDQGRLWSIPYFFGTQYEMPDWTAHIRYDEWTAIGRPEFNTPDEYREVLYRILEEFPLTPDGETRFAMSMPGFSTPSRAREHTDAFAGFWGFKMGYMIEDDGATWTHWSRHESGREMTRWFNQFHRDGTMDPSAFMHDFGEWREMFSRERIVGAIGGWWIGMHAGHEIWLNIDPDSPEDKRFL